MAMKRTLIYVATGEYNGDKRTYLVLPGLRLLPEERSQDQIIDAAVAKGFDVTFCTSYHGIGSRYSEDIREAIVKRFRKDYGANGWTTRNDWDVQVDVVNRIIKYEET